MSTSNIRHPKGLWFLFGTEMWERFGYYLMLGIFSLYMIDGWNNGGMGFDSAKKSDIYGTYLGLVYLTPFIGGLIADRILGYRLSIIAGGLMMAAGYFLLSVHSETTFYVALLLIILGNGFFKPNISTLVGNLYSSDEMKSKKDAGYNIFYMGINIGAFICNFVAAYMRINYGWGHAFAAAGVGMLIGVLIFLAGTKHIKHVDVIKPVKETDMSTVKILSMTVLPMFAFGVLGYLIPGNFLGSDTNDAFIIGCVPVILFFIYLAFTAEAKESRAIKALLAVFTCVILFFAIFHQNGDALTVWAEDFTDREMSKNVSGIADKAGLAQVIYNNPISQEAKVDLHKRKIEFSDSSGYSILKKAGGFLEKNTKEELANTKNYSEIISTYEKSLYYTSTLPKDKLNNANKTDTSTLTSQAGINSILSTPKEELPLIFTERNNFSLLKSGIEKKVKETDSIYQELLVKRLSMPDSLLYNNNVEVQKKINEKLKNQKKQLDTEIEAKSKELIALNDFLYKSEEIVKVKSNEQPQNNDTNLKLYSTELYQSINPFWVVLLTPIVVGIFGFLARKKREPSTPTKIGIGLVITALSALVMVGAVAASNDLSSKAGSMWLIASYGVITIGELCLSPMGLSLVSKLSPPRITALMMGGFFLAISVGNKLSGMLSSLWETMDDKANFFYLNFGLVMAAALLLFVMLRWLNKVMKENNVH